jgi:hypothetical protein
VCVSWPCRQARCAVRTAAREVAQPIAYLASSQAASITVADFRIDIGLGEGPPDDDGLAEAARSRRPGQGGPVKAARSRRPGGDGLERRDPG